jgi:hypothetical protein
LWRPKIIDIHGAVGTERDFDIVIAGWIAAPRYRSNLPLEHSRFIITEIRPEQALWIESMGQKAGRRGVGRMIMSVPGREDHKLWVNGLDKAACIPIIRRDGQR